VPFRSKPRALAALDPLAPAREGFVLPASEGGYFDPHNFRSRHWQPALIVAGI
jgi:hypothetical protein